MQPLRLAVFLVLALTACLGWVEAGNSAEGAGGVNIEKIDYGERFGGLRTIVKDSEPTDGVDGIDGVDGDSTESAVEGPAKKEVLPPATVATTTEPLEPIQLNQEKLRGLYDSVLNNMVLLKRGQVVNEVEKHAERHGVEERDLAQLVRLGSAWAVLDGEVFTNFFEDNSDIRLYSDGWTGSLADVLYYLMVKKYGKKEGPKIANRHFTQTLPDDSPSDDSPSGDQEEEPQVAVLVDDIFMRRVVADPEYKERFAQAPNVRFVFLLGYTMGINLVNHWDIGDQIQKLAKTLKTSGLGLEEKAAGLRMILESRIHNFMSKHFPDHEPAQPLMSRAQMEYLSASDDDLNAVYDNIHAMVTPKIPTFERFAASLEEALAGCTGGDEVIRDLGATLNIFSMTALSGYTQNLRHKLGRAASEKTWYIIPTRAKSYVMAAYIYLMANSDISPTQVVGQDHIGDKLTAANTDMVVIIDDYAGSGDSLIEERGNVEKTLKGHGLAPNSIVVAPIVASMVAQLRFEQTLPENARQTGTGVLQPQVRKDWMGYPGHKDGLFFVALAYMSPDNDASLFSKYIAPLFVWEENAIKKVYSLKPLCTPGERIEKIASECVLAKVSGEDARALEQRVHKAAAEANPRCIMFVLQAGCKAAKDGDEPVKYENVLQGLPGSWGKGYRGFDEINADCVREAMAAMAREGAFMTPYSSDEGITQSFKPWLCEELLDQTDSLEYVKTTCRAIGRYIFNTKSEPGLFGFTRQPAPQTSIFGSLFRSRQKLAAKAK